MVANGPVIIFASDGIRQRASLRMALDASIVCGNIIHSRGIENVSAHWMLYVLAARPVALFAAHVPLCHLFGLDVVVDGVAPVAGRARRALHIVRRIVWFPPVSSLGNEIRPPNSMGNIPLRGLGKVIVSSFREVT